MARASEGLTAKTGLVPAVASACLGVLSLRAIVVMVVVMVVVHQGPIRHGLCVGLLAGHGRGVATHALIQVVDGLGAARGVCVVAHAREGAVAVHARGGSRPATIGAQVLKLLPRALNLALTLSLALQMHLALVAVMEALLDCELHICHHLCRAIDCLQHVLACWQSSQKPITWTMNQLKTFSVESRL